MIARSRGGVVSMTYFSRGVSFLIIVAAFAAALVPLSAAQFETRSSFPFVDPFSVGVGDFNGDGKLDLAVGGNQLSILVGNGDGTFRPPKTYSSVIAPISVAVADFNHDGKLDLALATYLDNSVTIMLGNGDGTFSQGPILKAPSSPMFVAVGDFNHDGNQDVVAVELGPGCDCIAVFLGNGDGTFQSVVNTPILDAIPSELAVGDFDHDGVLDVAVTEVFGSTDQVSIWLGNGQGSFHEGNSYALGSSPQSVAAADFNHDGNVDLAVGVFEGGVVSVLLGNGDGTFQIPMDYPVPFPGQVLASDLNRDRKLDLAVACGLTPLSGACVLLGNGDGTFQPAVLYPVAPVGGPMALGDFNGDHLVDILAGDFAKGYLVTLLNTGVVSFSPSAPLNFKKQAVGTTSAPQTVTLTNTSKTSLTVSSMKATGQFGMNSTCGSSVAPGANCTISVRFSPKTKGAKSGTVTINDSASSKPQVIELSGTGT
jgi:hypothetical protein